MRKALLDSITDVLGLDPKALDSLRNISDVKQFNTEFKKLAELKANQDK